MSATALRAPDNPAPARLWLQLWRGLSPSERHRIEIAGIAMLVSSALTALIPLFVGIFVDTVIQDGGVVGLADAWLPLLTMTAAMALISAMNVVQHQQIHTVTTSFTATMRQRVYAALLRWDLARYVDDAKGAVYGRANRSVEGAERLIKLGASDLLPAMLVTVFSISLAVLRFGTLGVIMAMVVPTGFALVRWQIRSQNGIRVEVARAKERIDGDVSALLTGLDVIRTTGVEGFFNSHIGRRCSALKETELRHHIAMSKFDAAKAANEAFWMIATLAAAIGLGNLSSPGDLAGAVLLYLAVTKPLRELHRVLDEGAEAALQTQNLQEDLAAPHDASYTPTRNEPLHSFAAPIAFDDDATQAAIQLRNVSFKYPQRDTPVIDTVSVSIASGERVGIVGASGCGKSTLLKLLARLVHGYEGDILLHGQSIQSVCREQLVTHLGYVGQRPMLFQGTIRDNLVLGRNQIGDEQLTQACTRANIHNDILAMHHGYDSIIGEEGARLSGGQSQRLCLARALVQTPPIMLLDEPTSALDGPSQSVVQGAIDGLQDVTLVIVAHRLSTLRTMDRILVMHEGRLVEDGSFDALTASGGRFSEMLRSEARGA